MPQSRRRVRVVAEATRQAGMVERERDTDLRRLSRERLLERERQLPGGLAGGLHERFRAGCAKSRLRVAGSEEGARPTMDDRLGGRHDDDEIGLHEGAIDARFGAVGERERDEIGIGGVVDDHAPAEVPCLRRRQQALELASPESTAETAGDEDRLPLASDAERRQLVEHGRERLGSRIDLRAGQRQRGGLDDDGDATALRQPARRAARPRAESAAHRAPLPRRRRRATAERADTRRRPRRRSGRGRCASRRGSGRGARR